MKVNTAAPAARSRTSLLLCAYSARPGALRPGHGQAHTKTPNSIRQPQVCSLSAELGSWYTVRTRTMSWSKRLTCSSMAQSRPRLVRSQSTGAQVGSDKIILPPVSDANMRVMHLAHAHASRETCRRCSLTCPTKHGRVSRCFLSFATQPQARERTVAYWRCACRGPGFASGDPHPLSRAAVFRSRRHSGGPRQSAGELGC